MPANTKAIKRRIKSVKNTRKITKAMEMVAASKMRRAVSSVVATRPFTKLAWSTVKAVAKVTDSSLHPLLAPRDKVKRVLFLLFTSDRGLCGGFNSRMLKEATAAMNELKGAEIDVMTIGKRGAGAMRRANRNVVASFTELSNKPQFTDIRPIKKLVVEDYLSGKYDKVYIAYTDFVSALTQNPNVIEFLPLKSEESKDLGHLSKEKAEKEIETLEANEYVFEPSPQAVLDNILPRIVETMIWQALLESAASEHSARMLAMRSATDAAADMIDSLTFTFNQVRQAGITQEIAEISSGKAALES